MPKLSNAARTYLEHSWNKATEEDIEVLRQEDPQLAEEAEQVLREDPENIIFGFDATDQDLVEDWLAHRVEDLTLLTTNQEWDLRRTKDREGVLDEIMAQPWFWTTVNEEGRLRQEERKVS